MSLVVCLLRFRNKKLTHMKRNVISIVVFLTVVVAFSSPSQAVEFELGSDILTRGIPGSGVVEDEGAAAGAAEWFKDHA